MTGVVTTGNDPVPADVKDTPTPQAAAETPAPASTVTDPDELELIAARAEAKTEEASGKDPAESPGSTPVPNEQQPKENGEPASAGQPMIPKARLDEVLGRADKAERAAAYWQGVAEARAQSQAQPAPGKTAEPQPQPQTPEQRIAALKAEKQALTKQFDDGELTLTDVEAKKDAIDEQIMGIREEALLAKAKPSTGQSDALYLETLTAQLENEHPWVAVFDQVGTDSEWAFLKARAIENLAEQRIDPTAGSTGAYHLRREMARLADELGPGMLTARASKQGIALPGSQPQTAQQKPLSPEAKARQDKLALHAGAPPNVTSMSGSGGTSPGVYTDSQIEAMDESDYDKLPAAVRQKLRGFAA